MPCSAYNLPERMFSFLVITWGWISTFIRETSSVAEPSQEEMSFITSSAISSSKGSGGSFHNSVSALCSSHNKVSVLRTRYSFWSCWSLPDTSKVAALPVRFSFWRRNAPSAAPSSPLVPEIISNLSSAVCFLVWCTSRIQRPWASAKLFWFLMFKKIERRFF